MTQQTAKKAIALLIKKDSRFHEPDKKQRTNLSVAFARKNMILYGRAFDIIKLKKKINLDDGEKVFKNIDSILVYEIKSTANKDVGKNFENYFFSLSTAKLLVAQSLNDRFRFVLVNILTKETQDLTLKKFFKKVRKIYPTWSVSF